MPVHHIARGMIVVLVMQKLIYLRFAPWARWWAQWQCRGHGPGDMLRRGTKSQNWI